MEPKVTLLASGLNLLSFQGVTTFDDTIVVATIDADLIRVALDGTLTRWINLAKYGIPTGIFGLKDSIAVVLSGQDAGHFLMQVTKQGKVSLLADLSNFAGEFGAPFDVTAYEGYYPYYLVAISTDVVAAAGAIIRVPRSGKPTILANLSASPFGVGLGEDYAIATQDNGQVIKIDFAGDKSVIADLKQANLGSPIGVDRFENSWIVTTTTGWLVALKLDGTFSPLLNVVEIGKGLPTTLTAFADQIVVATQSGNLLRVFDIDRGITYELGNKYSDATQALAIQR